MQALYFFSCSEETKLNIEPWPSLTLCRWYCLFYKLHVWVCLLEDSGDSQREAPAASGQKGALYLEVREEITQLHAGRELFHIYSSLVLFCDSMDFQSVIKGWIKAADECWTSRCEARRSKRHRGRDSLSLSLLWTGTQASIYQTGPAALAAPRSDRAAISLPTADTASSCRPLSRGALPRNAGVKRYRAWRRRRWYGGSSSWRKKKRRRWLSGSGCFFKMFLLSRDDPAAALRYRMRTLEESEDRRRSLSVHNENLCVVGGKRRGTATRSAVWIPPRRRISIEDLDSGPVYLERGRNDSVIQLFSSIIQSYRDFCSSPDEIKNNKIKFWGNIRPLRPRRLITWIKTVTKCIKHIYDTAELDNKIKWSFVSHSCLNP